MSGYSGLLLSDLHKQSYPGRAPVYTLSRPKLLNITRFPPNSRLRVEEKINSLLNKPQVTTSYIQNYWETVLPKWYPNRPQTTWEIYLEFSRHTTYTDGTSAYPLSSTKSACLYFLFTEFTVQQTETFLTITEQKSASTKKSLCPYDLE